MALGRVHGEFEPRALRLVLEWAELHKAECLRIGNSPGCIQPADASPLAAWPLSRRASGAPHCPRCNAGLPPRAASVPSQ